MRDKRAGKITYAYTLGKLLTFHHILYDIKNAWSFYKNAIWSKKHMMGINITKIQTRGTSECVVNEDNMNLTEEHKVNCILKDPDGTWRVIIKWRNISPHVKSWKEWKNLDYRDTWKQLQPLIPINKMMVEDKRSLFFVQRFLFSAWAFAHWSDGTGYPKVGFGHRPAASSSC